MRRDHRPYWIREVSGKLNDFYVNHFTRPQFDSSGIDLRVMNPKYLEISGPKISVGKHVHFMALRDAPVRLAVFEGLGEIEIGDYSIVNPGVRVSSASSIVIGHSCMLAMNCYLSDANWHDIEHRIYAPGAASPIRLEENVWIGDSALVTKGVTVGKNSIVAANSVVTKDVPENSIVAGNPAQVVKSIDDSHLTLRRDLFNASEPYAVFEDKYFRELLAGNSLRGWIKSLFKPGKED